MRLLLTIALLMAAVTAHAQSFFSRDYWLSEPGVPQKVSALAQDARGYLYLGTDAGIYRFNGRSFLLMDSLRQPVTALASIGASVYAGFANGTVARISGARIFPLRWQGPHPRSVITALTAKGDVLFACTDAEGFFAIAGGYSRQVNMASGLPDNYVYALTFPGDSTIIAATDRGLTKIECSAKGRLIIKPALPPDALPDNIVRVLRPAHRKGSFWGGMQAAGLLLYREASDAATAHLDALSERWPWGQINDILPAGESRLWVATESGYLLECLSSADSGYIIHPQRYKGRKLRKLLQDRSGNIWCATSDGITLITANYLRSRRMSDGYSLQSLAAMSFDKKGNLWYSQGQQLCRMHPEGNPEKVFTAPAPITAIYPDAAGRIWIGTLGAGLLCRTQHGLEDIADINKAIDKTVLNIAGNGTSVWVSSLNGVEEIRTNPAPEGPAPSIVRHHGKATGAGSDYVYQVFPDSRGRIWFATDGAGITMWDGHRYHAWDTASGFDSKVIYSITEDRRGHIWAASLEKGLYEWDGHSWQQLGEACGLQDVHISAIAGTGSGQLAIAHSKGLDQWYPDSRNFRHYNRKSGLDIDSQSSALNCYATDREGNVWMPYEDGLVQFLAQAEPYPIKPGISIKDVAINQRSLQDRRRRFAADENYVGFRYEAIAFTNPEKLFYRYRLEGYDRNWITTSDEQVTFPRLPPGAYTFRAQAALDPAFDGAAEASYSFYIAAPLWQRPWMIVLMALAIGSIIVLLMRLRERQRQRLAALYQARLVAEYEQLKSQINPHFLFNSLNTLVSLIEESPQSAVQYTTELSDLYRNMLAYRDRDTILLGEELMLLQKYFFILKSRFADSIHLDIRVPEALQTRKRIVPLSLQMLVENAVKHNVVSPSRPLRILIEADEGRLSVRHALQPKLSQEKGAGLGLANIRNRYALLTKQSVSFGVCGADYVVTLPLL